MTDTTASRAPHAVGRTGLSLSSKIGAAFGLVLVLHITVAVMCHFGLQGAQRDMAVFDTGRRLTMAMVQTDRLVGEMQRHVQGYIFTGNRSLELRSEQVYDELVVECERMNALVDPAERSAIESMRATLDRYHTQFRLAVEAREVRSSLVAKDLPDLTERGEALLRQELAAVGVAPSIRGMHIREAQQHFQSAQNGAHLYLARLDSEAVRVAHTALAHARELLLRDGPAVAGGSVEVAEVFAAFDRALVGIVQHTRSYLHLVHVVLAGEAVEFLRQSSTLRELHLLRLDALQESIRHEQERYQMLSAIVSIATILLGLLAGAFLSRIVVQPLRAITATLARLARGDRSATIPGLHRKDEIGAMAKAAQVFHEKNEETRTLLGETEQLSRQRQQIISDLEQSNSQLESFSHIASHDLRAPLRAMSTVVSWIEEDCGAVLPVVSRDHLRMLRRRVERMDRLLTDLQAYSRANGEAFAIEDLRVADALCSAAELVMAVAGFRIEITGGDVEMRTARVPLEHVVGNLLSNAIRHHDRGQGVIEVDVQAYAEGVEITVTDDGPGIPSQYHQLVFQPFKTLQPRDVVDSSGVGLAIVHKFVTRYGGTIQIESPVAANRGARFRLRWPGSPSAAVAQPSEAAPALSAASV